MRVGISIDPRLLEDADRVWRTTGKRSRSALIEEVLRAFLAEQEALLNATPTAKAS